MLGGRGDWLGRHKQRLLWALAAVAMGATIAAATIGGFLLHHAAVVERQALRTQELAASVTRLHGFWLRLDAEGATAPVLSGRSGALADANAAFRDVGRYDHAEGARVGTSYLAYLAGSTRGFRQATESGGMPPLAEQRVVDGEFSRLQTVITAESSRLARATRVANPKVRFALISAALAAALLVALLIWQFELQRRAGRIDRDNAERSEELSRLREEFVAAVSHELRTPLTSIIGYLDLINEPDAANLTADQQAFLTIVQRNADRLHELVGDLLLVAESHGGALVLEVRAVDLDALATDSVESAGPAADERQIELTLSLGGAREMRGDPFRLGQMMDNLLSNAIKFTPVGGQVVVRTGLEDGYALFEVTDSGPGIAPADQAQLFDRFFRTRAAVDQAIRGTGLGLAITKAIVDAHHGSITVESAVGRHSTFRVRLPQTQVQQGG